MPYYIAQLEPSPPRGLSPVGWDSQPNRNWILLGNEALMWLETDIINVKLDKLGDDKDELLGAVSALKLTTFLGDRIVPVGTKFVDAIVDFLRNPPAGKWGALQPSLLRQQFEIWLGPGKDGENLFFSEAAVVLPASKTIQDTFNRADANLAGSTSSDGLFTWGEPIGTEWEVNTNAGQCINIADGTFNVALADFALDTDDHFASGDLTIFARDGASQLFFGMLVRLTTGLAGTPGYGLEVGNSGAAEANRLYNYATDANIATNTAVHSAGVIRLEVDGSSLTGKDDGVTFLGPSTDVAHAGQVKTGISSFSSGNSINDVGINVFDASDLVLAGAKNYYTGGYANAQRMARGVGFGWGR